MNSIETGTTPSSACRAELIFYMGTEGDGAHTGEVLDDHPCDCTRPDWKERWSDWRAGQNPHLDLFLCKDHARKLGLIG
jgi:hypothetical protein